MLAIAHPNLRCAGYQNQQSYDNLYALIPEGMHDIVAERAGVPAAVLVGVKARQHLRAEVFIAEQTHFPLITFCNLFISGGASESKLECSKYLSYDLQKKE